MNSRIHRLVPAAGFLMLLAIIGINHAMAQDPIVDGMTEERTGVVERIDLSEGRIVVGGETFSIIDNHDEVRDRMLGDAMASDESIGIASIEVGDRIRYTVDAMSMQLGDQMPVAFVLGVE